MVRIRDLIAGSKLWNFFLLEYFVVAFLNILICYLLIQILDIYVSLFFYFRRLSTHDKLHDVEIYVAMDNTICIEDVGELHFNYYVNKFFFNISQNVIYIGA